MLIESHNGKSIHFNTVAWEIKNNKLVNNDNLRERMAMKPTNNQGSTQISKANLRNIGGLLI